MPTSSQPAATPIPVVFAHLDFDDGGAQRLVLRTARHLDRRRFAPWLLAVRGRGALLEAAREEGLPVLRLGRLGRSWDLGAVADVARALRSLDARIVQAPLYSRALPYLRVAARLARVPLFVGHEHMRAGPPPPARAVADALLLHGPLARDLRFVAVSRALQAELIAGGAPASRIVRIEPGIERARFGRLGRAEARARLGVDPSRPLLLQVGRLHPDKGHADLIAALPRVLASRPGLQLVCLGDGPLRDALPALAESAGLGRALRFLGTREDVPAWMAAADLLVLPSRREGLPAVLAEAMAAGLPSVAAAVGGVPEVLSSPEAGWLVPPASPPALAAAILDALAEPPELRRARARRCRREAASRFDAGRQTARLQSVWWAWLAERGALPGAAPGMGLVSPGILDSAASAGPGRAPRDREGASGMPRSAATGGAGTPS